VHALEGTKGNPPWSESPASFVVCLPGGLIGVSAALDSRFHRLPNGHRHQLQHQRRDEQSYASFTSPANGVHAADGMTAGSCAGYRAKHIYLCFAYGRRSLTFRKPLASSAPMLSPASDTPLKASSRASLAEEPARVAPEPELGLEELAEGDGCFSEAHSCSITTSTLPPSLHSRNTNTVK